MAEKKSVEKSDTKKAAPKKAAPAKAEVKSDSKFAQFLATNKLDVRRILAASHALETLTREDRDIKRNKRVAKKGEGGDDSKKETRKPRSGRPVTQRAVNDLMAGKKISGPTKTRLLRAVNKLLEQKKKPAVDLKALF